MIIGLTGGIASGKSTAAARLGTLGAYVIDADKLGHRAYLQGTQAYREVIATFGEDIVTQGGEQDGEIDRRALGAKVFGVDGGLAKLTGIVWPAIHDMAQAEIKAEQTRSAEAVVVLEAAVLIEAGWQDLVEEIWVTVVDRQVAIARAMARDDVDAAAVEARIDSQISNEERTRHAQQVIDNSGSEAELIAQVDILWATLNK